MSGYREFSLQGFYRLFLFHKYSFINSNGVYYWYQEGDLGSPVDCGTYPFTARYLIRE